MIIALAIIAAFTLAIIVPLALLCEAACREGWRS